MAEREAAAAPAERPRIRRANRFLVRMLVFLVAVAALAFALVVALGVVASLVPAWRVYRLPIAAALRREGD